jgi:hypothetical protein
LYGSMLWCRPPFWRKTMIGSCLRSLVGGSCFYLRFPY